MPVAAWILGVSLAGAATLELTAVVSREVPAAAVGLEVHGRWLDRPFVVELSDADGVRGDGLWTGHVDGPAARMVPLALVVRTSDGATVELASTTELLDEAGGSVTWALDGDPRTPGTRARRVALARPARQLERFETATTAAWLGWLGVLFVWVVGWGGDRALRARRRTRARR